VIKSQNLDHTFTEEIMAEPGGEHLLTCWSCGTCAATCLIRRFDPEFNPRIILHKAGLGLREEVLSSKEIWLCSACDACYARCPKGIHISEVMKAIRDIAIREGYEAPGPFPEINEDVCSGCAVCTRACPYEAMDCVARNVNGAERAIAQVNRNLCMACGVCVAACPSGAIGLEEFSDSEILARAGAGGWLDKPGYVAGGGEEPRILAFVCQWSLRSDDEWQRLEHLGEHVRVVNLPCSGRVDSDVILMALSKGVDGVLVAGCREGECHYQRGTYQGRAKVRLLDQVLDQMGIYQSRVQFVELGALDRFALAPLIEAMSREIKSVALPTV